MKKYNYIYVLTLATVLITACQDDDTFKSIIKPAEIGEEIIFGVRAGFENANPDTRTVYGDENDRYEVNGVKYEMIKWVDKDKIQIYSNEATSPEVDGADAHTAHYVINSSSEDKSLNQYAFLTSLNETSLQWGSGNDANGTHIFYAMYPSSFMFGNTDAGTTTYPTYAENVGMDGSTIKGFVDYSQQPLEIKEVSENNFVAVPNMKFAYMAAKTTTTRQQAYQVDPTTGETKGVNLTFFPIVTAVEINMTLDETVTGSGTGVVNPVNIGEIQVTGTNIAGAFTADLSSWNGQGADNIPTVADETSTYDYINVSTWRTVDGKLVPTTIQPGGSITFTVFLKPGETDIENLQVKISDAGATWQSKTLENVTIQTKKKNILTNLKLPTKAVDIDNSNWMSQLDDQSLLGRLSIPGTGQSLSYLNNKTYNGDANYYKAQLITIEDQWKMGIRAFEITCSRHNASKGNLGTINVTCNGNSIDQTVRNVFDQLLASDDNPETNENVTGGLLTPSSDETAMVIITYQPLGGNDANRNPAYFLAQLNTLYDELNSDEYYNGRFVLYSPTLTLKEARGKVMIVVRPTQYDEDNDDVRSSALTAVGERPILVVDGCGSGKDKWGHRGYYVGEQKAADIYNAATGATVFEPYFVAKSNWFIPEDAANVSYPDWTTNNINKKDADFEYATNNDDYKIWYQEWSRVVEKDFKVQYERTVGGTAIIEYSYAYWRASYNEKLENVIDAFDMAINDTYKDTYVFINSLCGYYLDETNKQSYCPYYPVGGIINLDGQTGGLSGRIGDLADDLNDAFYQHVLEAGMNSKTGPTGVVMMDRVSNDATNGGASYILPSVIIANNFKSGSGGNVAPPEDPNTPPTDPETPEGGTEG